MAHRRSDRSGRGTRGLAAETDVEQSTDVRVGYAAALVGDDDFGSRSGFLRYRDTDAHLPARTGVPDRVGDEIRHGPVEFDAASADRDLLVRSSATGEFDAVRDGERSQARDAVRDQVGERYGFGVLVDHDAGLDAGQVEEVFDHPVEPVRRRRDLFLSLIHISEPTRRTPI